MPIFKSRRMVRTILKTKKDNLRVCENSPAGLNDYLLIQNYPLPISEVFAKLNGQKCFLKLDFSVVYLRIQFRRLHTSTKNQHAS